MAKRTSEIDRIAAQQLALEWIVANMATMQRIARACFVDVHEVTGPAVDAAASLLLRNSDPSENVALLRDYVSRELRPTGPTFDPLELEAHGGRRVALELSDAWLYHAGSDGRVRHIQRRWHIDAGRDHRRAGWRARRRRWDALQKQPEPTKPTTPTKPAGSAKPKRKPTTAKWPGAKATTPVPEGV